MILSFSSCYPACSKSHGVPNYPSKLKPFPGYILVVHLRPTATILQRKDRLNTIVLLLFIDVSKPTLGMQAVGKMSKIIGKGKVESGEKGRVTGEGSQSQSLWGRPDTVNKEEGSRNKHVRRSLVQRNLCWTTGHSAPCLLFPLPLKALAK